MSSDVQNQTASANRLWQALSAATDPQVFYSAWLALQASLLTDMRSGMVLVPTEQGPFAPISIWPNGLADIKGLAETAQKVLESGQPVMDAAVDGTLQRIGVPVEGADSIVAVVTIALPAAANPDQSREMLLWGLGWITNYEREGGAGSPQDENPLAPAFATLAALQAEDKFEAGLIALVNEIASNHRADRVSFCKVTSKGAKLLALSRAGWFDRKSDLTAAIELAAEEAADQRQPILWPEEATGNGPISLAHKALVERHETRAVFSVLVAAHGQTVGVVTVERREDLPFAEIERTQLELVGALLAPTLYERTRNERLVSGKIRTWLETYAAHLMGPEKLGVKLISCTIALVLLGMAIIPTDFEIGAKAVLRGAEIRVATAPFDGFVATAPKKAGDNVEAGSLLAQFDERDLKLVVLKWEAEKGSISQQLRDARAADDLAQTRILTAKLNEAEAELRLASDNLARATIRAPISGLIVSGDLSQQIGAPLSKGDVLFELAPENHYRLDLYVSDFDMAHISQGQTGRLALSALSGQSLGFTIVQISPVAEVLDGENRFKVEAKISAHELQPLHARVRPGMEGAGRIVVDRRSLLYVWGRPMISRLRLFLWKYLP